MAETCVICLGPIEPKAGCNPAPVVDTELGQCCSECDLRFVIPVRCMNLDRLDAVAHPALMKFVIGLARTGRSMVEGRKAAMELVARESAKLDRRN